MNLKKEERLAYPERPDARGSAKKYYRRRAYYFGKHNSPESLILFGLWKQRLIETGNPPSVSSLRRSAKFVLKCHSDGNGDVTFSNGNVSGAPSSIMPRGLMCGAAFSLFAILVSIVVYFKSEADSSQLNLTADERSLVENYRGYKETLENSPHYFRFAQKIDRLRED